MSFIGPGSQVRRETGRRRPLRVPGPEGRGLHASRRAGPASRARRVDPVNVAEARAGGAARARRSRPGATISGVAARQGRRRRVRLVGLRARREPGRRPGHAARARSAREEPTGPDGAFLLEGSTAGETYELQVMGPGRPRPAQGRRRGAGGGRRARRSTGTGQIRGRVVDADSGRAVPDFQLRYQPDAQGGMRFVMRAGPGPGARAVRAAVVPRGGRRLRARGRAGGALDGRGLRPGLPGGQRVRRRRSPRARPPRASRCASRRAASSAGRVLESRGGAARSSTPPCARSCRAASRAWA